MGRDWPKEKSGKDNWKKTQNKSGSVVTEDAGNGGKKDYGSSGSGYWGGGTAGSSGVIPQTGSGFVVPQTGGAAQTGAWEERLQQETADYLNRQTAAWDPNTGSNSMMDAYRADYEAQAQAAAAASAARARDMAGGWGSSYAALAASAAYESVRDNAVARAKADWESMAAERQQQSSERLSVTESMAERETEQAEQSRARRQEIVTAMMTPDEEGNVLYNGRNAEEAYNALELMGYGKEDLADAFGAADRYYSAVGKSTMEQQERYPETIYFPSLEAGAYNGQDPAAVSRTADKGLRYAMQNPETAGAMMGYSDEEWQAFTDADRAEAVMEQAKRLTRAGTMSGDDFAQFLEDDMRDTLDGIPWEGMETSLVWTRNANIKQAAMQMSKMVLEAQADVEAGYIKESDYLNILSMIAERGYGMETDIWSVIEKKKGSWFDEVGEAALDELLKYREAWG